MTCSPALAAGAALIEAAAAGRIDEVARLIQSGAPLDAQDAQGRSALLRAVAGDHVSVAKVLLEAGASPNTQAANRDTPWLLAGALGRAEIIAAMLPRKPDLSIRNRYGGNALIPACERAHVEAVKLLLTSGIDLDHVNDLGWTCLLEIVILGRWRPSPPAGRAAGSRRRGQSQPRRQGRRDAPRPCPPAGLAGDRAPDRTGRRSLKPRFGIAAGSRYLCANAAWPPSDTRFPRLPQ
ncbi:hypothetical protein ABIE41_000659 [Bosea sp. OAE506]